MLIDSGSTSSLIATHQFAKLSPNQRPAIDILDQSVCNVNGSTMKVNGKAIVKLQIGNQTFNHPMIVCDMVPDGILGQDFLLSHVKMIDYENFVMKTGVEEIQCWTGGTQNRSMTCRVTVRTNTQVPPQTSIWLPVDIKNKGHMTSLMHVQNCDSVPIHVVEGIISKEQDDTHVNILNCSEEHVCLEQGAEIGFCESIDENIQVNVNGDRCAQTQISENTCEQVPEHLRDMLCRSSTHLNDCEKKKFEKLLIQYQGAFAKSNDDLGCTNLIQHHIDTQGARPIRQPPRRLPLAKRETERNEIEKMLKAGIIEPSISEWSSPVLLLTKKDGTTRFAVDYRKINEKIRKDSFPLARIDDCLDALAGAQYYSCMDLNQGFLQMPVAPESRDKTAFATSLGLFQFLRLPYGLVTAPSEFSRLMGEVLRGLQWKECLVYMDDIIVPGKTVDETLHRLEHVFQRLEKAGLKLKPKKCTFFQKSVKVLGHVVSATGVTTDEDKISAVLKWPTPTSAKQLKSFLGLATYYKRFVKDFSKIAKPLYQLCHKNVKYSWNPEANTAFEALKEALTTAPVLAYPSEDLPFCLDTDASDHALGAVLSQTQDGQERVIAYMSKTLNDSETRYCVTRKELLAVVTALKHFHHYLYGQEVLVRTDNAAVSWIRSLKNPTGQIARWLQYIETYNLTVTHRPGYLHTNADALSRAPCKSCKHQEKLNQAEQDQIEAASQLSPPMTPPNNPPDNLNDPLPIRATTRGQQNKAVSQQISFSPVLLDGWLPNDVHHEQVQDRDIGPIATAMETGQRPEWNRISQYSPSTKALWRQWDRLERHGNMLYRRWITENERDEKVQLVVPISRRQEVLHNYHDIPTAGHLSSDKMLDRIRQLFYWPGMTKDIISYCEKCDPCAARKPAKLTRAPLGEQSVGASMEKVAVDILGPLPVSEKGNRFILVIVDLFTKYTEAVPLPNQEALTVANAFIDNFVTRLGVPLMLLSDHGTNFESKLFMDMCEILDIKKVTTSIARPQANGSVERFNRTLASMLTMYCSKNQNQWDRYLQQVMMAYRASKHAATGLSPNMMTFGREINLPMTAVIGRPPQEDVSVEQHIESIQQKLVEAHEQARQSLQKQAAYQKRH